MERAGRYGCAGGEESWQGTSWTCNRQEEREGRGFLLTWPLLEVVDESAEYMVYCCAASGNRETMMVGKSIAVNFFHMQWLGKSLPLNHFRIKMVKEGI